MVKVREKIKVRDARHVFGKKLQVVADLLHGPWASKLVVSVRAGWNMKVRYRFRASADDFGVEVNRLSEFRGARFAQVQESLVVATRGPRADIERCVLDVKSPVLELLVREKRGGHHVKKSSHFRVFGIRPARGVQPVPHDDVPMRRVRACDTPVQSRVAGQGPHSVIRRQLAAERADEPVINSVRTWLTVSNRSDNFSEKRRDHRRGLRICRTELEGVSNC